jgi:hypothetical protein
MVQYGPVQFDQTLIRSIIGSGGTAGRDSPNVPAVPLLVLFQHHRLPFPSAKLVREIRSGRHRTATGTLLGMQQTAI